MPFNKICLRLLLILACVSSCAEMPSNTPLDRPTTPETPPVSSSAVPRQPTAPADPSIRLARVTVQVPGGFCDATYITVNIDLPGMTHCGIEVTSLDASFEFKQSFNLTSRLSDGLLNRNLAAQAQTIEIDLPVNARLQITGTSERKCGRCYAPENFYPFLIEGSLTQTLQIESNNPSIALNMPTFPACYIPDPPECFPDRESYWRYDEAESRIPVTGFVYDDQHQPVADAQVIAEFLGYIWRSTTSDMGEYTLPPIYYFTHPFINGQLVPTPGVVNIYIEKEGYAPRHQYLRFPVAKGQIRHLNFGFGDTPLNGGSAFNALSQKPEVIRVSPAMDAVDVSPDTTFEFTFSQPMNRESVESNFAVYTASPGQAEYVFRGNKIADRHLFNMTWEDNNTQVRFEFKKGHHLPVDPDAPQIFQMAFNGKDGILRAQSGTQRQDAHFFRFNRLIPPEERPDALENWPRRFEAASFFTLSSDP